MPPRNYSLNGKTRNLPPGVDYDTKQIPRKPYLQAIRGRLQGDVGFLLECLEKRNENEPRVGFFAMVRAVMPIVETLAIAEGRYQSEVLGDLGFGAPNLTWKLYRNVFLHGDEFVLAAVGDQFVGSGIDLSRADQDDEATKKANDGLVFDAAYTYRRLLKYIDAKIDETSDDAMVDVITTVRYDPECSRDGVALTASEVLAIHEAAQVVREAEG